MIKTSKKRIMLVLMSVLMLFTSMFSFNFSHKAEAELDPASKLICKFEDGKTIVNFYSTDYFQYITRSKSAVTSKDNVDKDWMNKILGLVGFDFTTPNETILGRELSPTEVPEGDPSDENKKAPKVSAFDRFGMAGLKWSSYQGEWKYYHVDACAEQDKVSPTNFGAFYEGRLEPKSTYNEVPTSVDNRSIQFNKGVMSSIATAFTDTISNFLFMITKIIVTLTITFVGLSFTDITVLFGMTSEDGSGSGTASGVFTELYNGLFSGFVLITFMLTALYIMYKGLIKRELKLAITTLIKTIVIFVIAGVMASNPSFWIGVPNKVATYGQAVMISTMAKTYEENGQYSLCSTNVSSIDKGANMKIKEVEKMQSDFDKVSRNMKSMIGCKMWEILLFKPWVNGQFGAEYEDLMAEKVKNDNSDWVGTPSVPLGGNKTVDNWALFHLSTQTNAHYAVGGGMPTYINGVTSDWWRVADAMSNYTEKTETQRDSTGSEQKFEVAVKTEPTEFWQSWTGNNKVERFLVAIVSILFGIAGSIAPLIFGIASAVYGIGITLLMMVAPVFLLLGTWGGKGDQIFMGWLSALINTVIKKIIVALLLVISLVLSMITMDMIDDIGFIKSFLLMCTLTYALIKNKDKLLEMVANVNFGGVFDPRTKANQIFKATNSVAKEIGKTGTAAVVGAGTAAQSGQSIFTGARVGVTRQLENRLQTTSLGRQILMQERIQSGGDKLGRQTCMMCHNPLGVNNVEVAYQDDDGNYYCVDCADEMGLENLYEVIAGDTKKATNTKGVKTLYENNESTNDPIMPEDIRKIKSREKSWVSHSSMREVMEFQKVEDEYQWNNTRVQDKIVDNIKQLKKDAYVYKQLHEKLGERVAPPSIPQPLVNYIDTAMINMAWSERRFNVVEETYKQAWMMWYDENGKNISNISDETIENFKSTLDKEVDNYTISEEQGRRIMDEYFNSNDSKSINKDESSYIYMDGKLVLRNKDIDETDERLSD